MLPDSSLGKDIKYNINMTYLMSYPTVKSQDVLALPLCLHTASQITNSLITFCKYTSKPPSEASDIYRKLHYLS